MGQHPYACETLAASIRVDTHSPVSEVTFCIISSTRGQGRNSAFSSPTKVPCHGDDSSLPSRSATLSETNCRAVANSTIAHRVGTSPQAVNKRRTRGFGSGIQGPARRTPARQAAHLRRREGRSVGQPRPARQIRQHHGFAHPQHGRGRGYLGRHGPPRTQPLRGQDALGQVPQTIHGSVLKRESPRHHRAVLSLWITRLCSALTGNRSPGPRPEPAEDSYGSRLCRGLHARRRCSRGTGHRPKQTGRQVQGLVLAPSSRYSCG